MRIRSIKRLWLAGLLGALAACGAGLEGGGGSGDDDGFVPGADAGGIGLCFSSNECPVGWTCNEFGQCEAPLPGQPDGGPVSPPEVERELSEPASSLRYLYVAMPDLDALAKIDGATLEVRSVSVGDRPEIVVTIPGGDDALVLDQGNATATIVRPTVDRDDKVTLATLPQVNRVDVDATGRYAVAWFDLTKAVADAGGLQNVGEIGSFQDVTVIDLTRGSEIAVDLAVGFRPREVEFDDAGDRAYVITDDGVSVIDLAAAAAGMVHVAATIPVAADPNGDPNMIEVEITGDGSWAVERELGRLELRVVAVGAGAGHPLGTTFVIPLPAEATDVDLTSSGHAYAMLRDASILAVIELPADAFDPEGVEMVSLGGELCGSAVIDEAHGRALLFTNAFEVEKLVVVDLVTPGKPVVARRLEKAVRTAALSPDGKTALVLHAKRPGNPLDTGSVDEFVDRSYGYSLVDLGTGFAKLALTPVDPGAFAFAPDGEQAYLALDGGDQEGSVRRLQVIDLRTFVVDDLQLGSPPEQVGVLPGAGVAFVSQRHALGRVTFVDLATMTTRTITGFELSSHIVD